MHVTVVRSPCARAAAHSPHHASSWRAPKRPGPLVRQLPAVTCRPPRRPPQWSDAAQLRPPRRHQRGQAPLPRGPACVRARPSGIAQWIGACRTAPKWFFVIFQAPCPRVPAGAFGHRDERRACASADDDAHARPGGRTAHLVPARSSRRTEGQSHPKRPPAQPSNWASSAGSGPSTTPSRQPGSCGQPRGGPSSTPTVFLGGLRLPRRGVPDGQRQNSGPWRMIRWTAGSPDHSRITFLPRATPLPPRDGRLARERTLSGPAPEQRNSHRQGFPSSWEIPIQTTTTTPMSNHSQRTTRGRFRQGRRRHLTDPMTEYVVVLRKQCGESPQDHRGDSRAPF